MTGTPLPFTLDGMDKVADKFDAINHTLKAMLDAMPKPESRATKILKVFVLVTGALGVVTIADIIRRWLTGG